MTAFVPKTVQPSGLPAASSGPTALSVLIVSLLARNEPQRIRELQPSLAGNKTDADLLEWAKTFLRDHGILPSGRMLKAAHDLDLHDDPAVPVSYLLNRASSTAIVRMVLEAALEVKEGHQKGFKAEDLLARISSLTRDCARVGTSSKVTSIAQSGQDLLREYEKVKRNGAPERVPFGWAPLDEATGGMGGEDLCTIVAETNIGKTQNLAWSATQAWKQGYSILLATNEMNTAAIARRVVGAYTGLNPKLIRDGQLSSWGFDHLVQALDLPEDAPRFDFLDGGFGLTVAQFQAVAELHDYDAFYVDAAYLMKTRTQRYRSRQEEFAELEGELKGFCKERQKPMLKTVQFSRDYQKERKSERAWQKRKQSGEESERDSGRSRKDPVLDEIAGSSSIEKDGDIIVALELGDSPRRDDARRWTLLKTRESGGKNVQFHTNYLFDPVDCSYIQLDHEVSTDEALASVWGDGAAV